MQDELRLAQMCIRDRSRSALQALVADGHVQCNGKTVAKSLKLKAGDTVLLEIPDAKPIEARCV